MSEARNLTLTDVEQKFVLHWGEMGTRWGINRTVAQIHALLFISPRPLNAEEITNTLSVARSNVSTSLKELLGWGIVRVVHVLGDRRDHFESLKDVWEMFRIIVEERKRREIDPTARVLKECVEEAGDGSYAGQQMAALLDFFDTMTLGYDQIKGFSPATLKKMAKSANKMRKLLGMG